MGKTLGRTFALAITGLWAASTVLAQAPANYAAHEFLTDYSLLEPFANSAADYRYVAPNAFKDLANYQAIMVDQPEIFISPDSKYKGAKPDDLKAIADLMRTSLATQLEEGGYNIVQSPGPGVLYLRLALSDLELIKKKRSILSFTPVGLVVHTVKTGAMKDMAKKVRLDYITLELEVTDSTTGDVLVAGLISQGGEAGKEKKQIVSWEVFEAYLQNLAQRMVCRLNNAKVPESDWADCLAIEAELTKEKR